MSKNKAVNLVHVHMVDTPGRCDGGATEVLVVEVHAAMQAGHEKLLTILDTACASSVMGCPALTAYMEEADRMGIEYVFENDERVIVVSVAVVACDVPCPGAACPEEVQGKDRPGWGECGLWSPER